MGLPLALSPGGFSGTRKRCAGIQVRSFLVYRNLQPEVHLEILPMLLQHSSSCLRQHPLISTYQAMSHTSTLRMDPQRRLFLLNIAQPHAAWGINRHTATDCDPPVEECITHPEFQCPFIMPPAAGKKYPAKAACFLSIGTSTRSHHCNSG